MAYNFTPKNTTVSGDHPGFEVEVLENLLIDHKHPNCKYVVVYIDKPINVTFKFDKPYEISKYEI